MALAPDIRVGRYQLLSLLGKGGMGEVYLAHDTMLRRSVAVKLLPREFTANRDRLERFEREAYAVSSLNHPNILTIYEVGVDNGVNFIATEFIDGESLSERMKRTSLSLSEILDIGNQVASGLWAAHSAGIVHRDIKPENIMLRHDGIVKVLDFGLAKVSTEQAFAAAAPAVTVDAGTIAGTVMGTVKYMSPEQARGLSLDARTDIFSFGVVMYEMIAGRSPFEGETNSDIMAAILRTEPPALAGFAPEAPPELERTVMKMLAKKKEDRYQSAADVASDLKAIRHHLEFDSEFRKAPSLGNGFGRAAEAAPAAHASSSAEYLVGEIKQHKLGAALTAGFFAVVLGAISFFYLGHGGSTSTNSIAILPFVNESHDPNLDYLSDGISEGLIDNLSQLPQLKVIARSSAFKYKGKEIDAPQIAKALGVQTIVTGRVAKLGDNLMVRAELVNARDNTVMWSEHYNHKIADLQSMQDEMAETISGKLRLRLTGAQKHELAKRATQNPQAYQLYLTGLFYGRRLEPESLKKSLEYTERAIALDPNFARAYAQRGFAYSVLAQMGVIDPKEAMPKAIAAAQKCLQLDGTLAEAHNVLGAIKLYQWNWSDGEAEFKQAIRLNPNYAGAYGNLAVYFAEIGRPDQALPQIKKAEELDPLRVFFRVAEGDILVSAQRYDSAIQVYQDVLKMQTQDPEAYVGLGYAYDAKGMFSEAVTNYQKAISAGAPELTTDCTLGYSYARSGKRKEAIALLNKLKTTREYVSPADVAILYAGLGNKDAALTALEQAYAVHDLRMGMLKAEPHFDWLRSDRRFQDLIRRVGLPQ